MESPLFYDQIEVGKIWISPRRTVTETDVINFANSTGDYNPLHVDFEFAAQSHYRHPIAHGLLGLAWVAGLGSYFPNVMTLAFTGIKDWQFSRPIYFGDSVYVETTCLEKEAPGRRAGKITWLRKLINQRDQIVQQGIFETLVAIDREPGKPHINTMSDQKISRLNNF
jgi:3-hydroxybutyryl-CoA dehydratase